MCVYHYHFVKERVILHQRICLGLAFKLVNMTKAKVFTLGDPGISVVPYLCHTLVLI